MASIGASDAVALELARRGAVAGLAFINPTLARPADLAGLTLSVGVVLAEEDRSQDPAAWARALQPGGGVLTVVPGATRTYQRNLPLVGKAVAALLQRLGEG